MGDPLKFLVRDAFGIQSGEKKAFLSTPIRTKLLFLQSTFLHYQEEKSRPRPHRLL